jgi:iron complex outermembrane receptor protein
MRNPIANEPHIRGQHLGEIQTWADGAYWFPARQDLDTFLSKIDSGIIKDAIIIKGPYTVRYGPGFSFIDIETQSTPRSLNGGFEWHGRTLSEYQFNGKQFYGRAGVSGGGEDYGVRLSYGQRTAQSYESGNDVTVPSGYDSRDIDFAFGYDLSPTDHLEFGYMRLDQTGLQFAGQVFDTDFLVTNGYRLRYTSTDKEWYDLLVVDGWYNRTSMHGDAQHPSKREFIPQLGALGNSFIAFTDIDQASTGYRAAATWGRAECREAQLTVGTDFRYLDGELNEIDNFGNLILTPCGMSQNFPIPRSHHETIGGLFAELVRPVNECFKLKFGARGDYVNTDIDSVPPGFDCGGQPSFFGVANSDFFHINSMSPTNFERNYGLWTAYGTAEYKLNSIWTATAGMAHAERPPTQTELYAMGPFLGVLQQGFTTVIGNPGLAPEQLWQIDLGMKADYGWARAGLTGFYGFVEDYITYRKDPNFLLNAGQGGLALAQSLTGALTVQYTNTGLATLSGFEFYADFDANDWLTPFANISFVEGRDQDINEPLPGIPPLEARVGFRIHEPVKAPRYGFEAYARIVNHQDRVASSLGEVPSAGFTIYNIRGYYAITRGTKTLLLTGGIDNLFDKTYREHLDLRTGATTTVVGTRTGTGVLEPGISPYLGIEYRW